MNLFRKTLDHCGYEEEPPTEEAVKNCFMDYALSGVFGNLDQEEINDIMKEESIETICKNLLRY